MRTTKVVREVPFFSLGSVPSPSHCIAILVEFRRYPAWRFFQGCLRVSWWTAQTSAAKRVSFPEKGASCSTHKRCLSFWPGDYWCKVSDCKDRVMRSTWSALFKDLGQPYAAPGQLETLCFLLQPCWSEGLTEPHTMHLIYWVTKVHVIYVSAF